MAEDKKEKVVKPKKMADPIAASIDPATQEMIARAQELGIEDKSNGMAVSWADCNNDGKLDLYVSNMHSYAGERITHNIKKGMDSETLKVIRRFAKGNALFVQDKNSFMEPVDLSSANGGWAWGNTFLNFSISAARIQTTMSRKSTSPSGVRSLIQLCGT